MIDQATLLLASADGRVSQMDWDVLQCLADGAVTTLDALAEQLGGWPPEHVFAAVARLEGYGYLPKGMIR